MIGTYDLAHSQQYSLDQLLRSFDAKGVTKLFWKALSPNDNSKNQPYLGGDLSALNMIPTGPLMLEQGNSAKPTTKAGTSLIKAPLDFYWISPYGDEFHAPNAQLILYPQYPEVRLSGFLRGSKVQASEWMDPKKLGRTEGRHLLLGVTPNGKVLAYLAIPGSQIAHTLENRPTEPETTLLKRISMLDSRTDDKQTLLIALKQIHDLGWHKSMRLKKNSAGKINRVEYKAPNGGGYTLEALLGIFPNGDAAPDYNGWEIKQYGVSNCAKASNTSKPVTLMTPEPDGGAYKDQGVSGFVKQFGYPDKLGRPNRFNFGGTHYSGRPNPTTNLTLNLSGFRGNGKFDANGALQLCSETGEIAASWSFTKLLEHWKKKHERAAYIPSLSTKQKPKEYYYCSPVYLAEGTDFGLYLHGISSGAVYYDPGIKVEKNEAGSETSKRRSQFRVRFKEVKTLYKHWSTEQL